MRQPARNTLRMEFRIDPDLRQDVAICALMDGKSDSEWIREEIGRAASRRIDRATDTKLRRAKNECDYPTT